MKGDRPDRPSQARLGDPRAADTRAAEREAADLGKSAAGEANKGGTATDEAESRVQEAVDAASVVAQQTGGMGDPGRPMNKRSPFYIGMTAAAGVAVTYGLVELITRSRSVLIIIGLGLFIAVGLDPVVSALTRRGMPRWAAVSGGPGRARRRDRHLPRRPPSRRSPRRRRRWPRRSRPTCTSYRTTTPSWAS